jgi:hypothetical protein
MAKKETTRKTVEALKHGEATRKNIPTAEYVTSVAPASEFLDDLQM